jgi:LemA protein
LIPNLVESVRGFAGHERHAIDAVVQAQAATLSAPTHVARQAAEAALGSQLTMLMTAAQTYPDLKASMHFTELRHELTVVESNITAARRFLNMATAEYNATLQQFPASVIGRQTGHLPRRQLSLGLERAYIEEVPSVRF